MDNVIEMLHKADEGFGETFELLGRDALLLTAKGQREDREALLQRLDNLVDLRDQLRSVSSKIDSFFAEFTALGEEKEIGEIGENSASNEAENTLAGDVIPPTEDISDSQQETIEEHPNETAEEIENAASEAAFEMTADGSTINADEEDDVAADIEAAADLTPDVSDASTSDPPKTRRRRTVPAPVPDPEPKSRRGRPRKISGE